jgi:rare lipoprotein A
MNKIFVFIVSLTIVFFAGCSTRGAGVYQPDGASDGVYSSATGSANKGKYVHPTMQPYVIRGIKYYPTVVSVGDQFNGNASWYGPDFHGKSTSNGEVYDMYAMTAAHKTLPMNTIVKVTNNTNGLSTVVRVNDRGPFVETRIIDLSKSAANKINLVGVGTAPVTVEVLGFESSTNTIIPSKEELQKSPQQTTISGFALQIASFVRPEGALYTQKKYDNTDGYQTIIKDTENKNGRVFKVLLKGFQSEEEARDYKAQGKFANAFILRED